MSEKSNRKNIIIIVEMILLSIIVVLIQMFEIKSWNHINAILSMLPILCGIIISGNIGGAWLGLLFGIATLFRPTVESFVGINASAGILSCLIMGTGAGVAASIIYNHLLEKKGNTVATFAGALAWPIVKNALIMFLYILFFRAIFANYGLYDKTHFTFFTWNLLFQTVQELIAGVVFAPIVAKICKLNEEKILNRQ